MLLFTCIKLVAHLLACALAIAHGSLLKCDQLKVFSLGITLVDVVQNWFNWFHSLFLLGGLLFILIDCMVFLSPFLVVSSMSQGSIQALWLTSVFHEGLSFMAIVHHPTYISMLTPCSWGFIWSAVNTSCGVQEQCPWKLWLFPQF